MPNCITDFTCSLEIQRLWSCGSQMLMKLSALCCRTVNRLRKRSCLYVYQAGPTTSGKGSPTHACSGMTGSSACDCVHLRDSEPVARVFRKEYESKAWQRQVDENWLNSLLNLVSVVSSKSWFSYVCWALCAASSSKSLTYFAQKKF